MPTCSRCWRGWPRSTATRTSRSSTSSTAHPRSARRRARTKLLAVDELALDTVADRTVADVMMTRPKTLRADATVADARSVFTNPKVQTCPILGDDGRLLGELAREQVPGAEADAEPARLHAD